MDPSVQVAAIGVFTTLLSVTGVVIVAIMTSKKERVDTADNAVEETLRERITLRDEQLADCKAEDARKEVIIERLRRLLSEEKEKNKDSGGLIKP